jgi:hypothetical protein
MFLNQTFERASKGLWLAFIAAVAMALAACGGGGSGNTVIDTPGKPLYTTASPALSLAVGASTTFSAGGGGGGAKFTSYSASSSTPSVATVSSEGSNFTVKALAAGNTTISVSDSVGAVVVIALTVPQPGTSGQPANPVALFVNAPAAVILAKGALAQYLVSGGTAPYIIASSAQHVVSATSSGETALVKAEAVGTATIVVFDAKGASQKFTVTVESAAGGESSNVPLYTTAPATLLLSNGMSVNYVIAGGTAPYFAASATPSQVGVAVSGNTMSISALASGQARITLRDAVGAQVLLSVGVFEGEPFALFTTAPSSIALNIGAVSTYAVKGGTPPYSASIDKQSIAAANVVDTTLTVRGINGGTANVVVFDSVGATVKIAATVDSAVVAPISLFTTAASTITVMPAASASFTVAGGAAPYTATSSDVSIATVALVGKDFSIVGGVAGTASIVVRDALGTLVTIKVIVP